ncbi:MAG TPA: hypothetical protein VIG62_07595 [Blastocatellia bacterium]|jgi:hypothetical protein
MGGAIKGLIKILIHSQMLRAKSVLGELHTQRQALNRFYLGAMVLSQPILDVIRRELKRLSPDVRIDTDQIKSVLSQKVLMREVVEGEKAQEARKKINRLATRTAKQKATKASAKSSGSEPTSNQPEGPATKVSEAETPEIAREKIISASS